MSMMARQLAQVQAELSHLKGESTAAEATQAAHAADEELRQEVQRLSGLLQQRGAAADSSSGLLQPPGQGAALWGEFGELGAAHGVSQGEFGVLGAAGGQAQGARGAEAAASGRQCF